MQAGMMTSDWLVTGRIRSGTADSAAAACPTNVQKSWQVLQAATKPGYADRGSQGCADGHFAWKRSAEVAHTM